MARDAQALATEPLVEVWIGQWQSMLGGPRRGPVAARAWISERRSSPAVDVGLQFTLASGRTGSQSVERLEPNEAAFPLGPPFLELEIGRADETWPAPGVGEQVDIQAWFSDVRRVAQYKLSMAAHIRQWSDILDGLSPSGWVSVEITKQPTTARISPTPTG
jgi:hypothetical protein